MERLGIDFLAGPAPTDVVEYVQLAEELGYESAWLAEGSGGDHFSILTACALATKRILLGTGVSSVFKRSAPTIAMAAACVDYFSNGRFILGLGSGHKVQVGEHGFSFSQPVQRLRDTIEIIRRLLRDGTVSYNGETINIENFNLWFEPVRKEIPIFVGAVNPKMLQICGEISQGALLTYCTLEQAKTAAEQVAIGAKRAGRNPEEVEVATKLPCVISPNKVDAVNSLRAVIAPSVFTRPRYRKLFAETGFAEEVEAMHRAWKEGDRDRAVRLMPAAMIERIALVGTPEECRERIQEYRRAGITLPIVSPRASGMDLLPSRSAKDFKRQAMDVIRACAPQ